MIMFSYGIEIWKREEDQLQPGDRPIAGTAIAKSAS